MRRRARARAVVALGAPPSLALTRCSPRASQQPAPVPQSSARFEVDPILRESRGLIEAGAVGLELEVRRGDEVYRYGGGVNQLTRADRANPANPLRVASVTKSMTATMIMQLIGEGRFTLDTPIEVLLPRFVPHAEGITVRMLLEHTSGLKDYVQALVGRFEGVGEVLAAIVQPRTNRELVRAIADEPLAGRPGEVYWYSNTNYVILGELIERIEHRPLAEVLQRRILDPANLRDTSLPSGTGAPETLAHGYFMTQGIYADVTEQNGSLYGAAGGVISTVSDVNSFYRSLLRGTFLPVSTVDRMRVTGGDDYGMGLMTVPDACRDASSNGTLYGHTGSGLGYRMLSYSTPDGQRQITVGWTTSSLDYEHDPRYDAARRVVDAAMRATCGDEDASAVTSTATTTTTR